MWPISILIPWLRTWFVWPRFHEKLCGQASHLVAKKAENAAKTKQLWCPHLASCWTSPQGISFIFLQEIFRLFSYISLGCYLNFNDIHILIPWIWTANVNNWIHSWIGSRKSMKMDPSIHGGLGAWQDLGFVTFPEIPQ